MEAAGDGRGEKASSATVGRRWGYKIELTDAGAPEDEKARAVWAWMEAVAARVPGHGGFFDGMVLWGMRVERVCGGAVVCGLRVSPHLADAEGTWAPGAIAAVIDVVGALAIASVGGDVKASVAFDISYFAPAKVEEEVAIEAKASYHAGQIAAVTVDVRKKGSGQPVACGRQWMASFPGPDKHVARNTGSKL